MATTPGTLRMTIIIHLNATMLAVAAAAAAANLVDIGQRKGQWKEQLSCLSLISLARWFKVVVVVDPPPIAK